MEIIANCFDPDQNRQNDGLYHKCNANCLTLRWYPGISERKNKQKNTQQGS